MEIPPNFPYFVNFLWFVLLFFFKFYFIVKYNIYEFIIADSFVFELNFFYDNDVIATIRYLQDIFILADNLYTCQAPLFVMLAYVLLAAMLDAIILALSTTTLKLTF